MKKLFYEENLVSFIVRVDCLFEMRSYRYELGLFSLVVLYFLKRFERLVLVVVG